MRFFIVLGYTALLFTVGFAIVTDWALMAALAGFTLGTNCVIDLTHWARKKAS